MPQVIAHRTLQMDRKEFHRMGAEKVFAFGESWNAMLMQAFLENHRLATSFMTSFWFPWLAPGSSASRQMADATLGILSSGMAPIQRRAVANAKRLRNRRRR